MTVSTQGNVVSQGVQFGTDNRIILHVYPCGLNSGEVTHVLGSTSAVHEYCVDG